jgi:hypothetical protein
VLLDQVANLLRGVLDASSRYGENLEVVFEVLFNVSQILFPDCESFLDDFLGVLRCGHKSILQSLVVQ